MRLPVLMLSVVAVPASVLAVPVASLPAPAPRAVAPEVRELELPVAIAATDVVRAAGAARPLVATPEQRTEPFSTVGVTWAPDEATGEVQVQVRTRSGGAWTPWVALESEGLEVLEGAPEDGAASVRPGTEPLFTGPSDGVQVRVDVLSGAAPRDLRLALVDPGSSPADAAAPSTPASTAHAAAGRPAIRSRAEWGADESIRKGSPSYASTLSAVTLHHTASSNDYTQADVPSLLRGFYAYHVKSQGWSDLGYNVLVDRFGTAWEGRAGGLDKPVVGAHAGGFNTGTSGVSMVGTYGTVEPSPAMKETVAQVSAWKLGLHDRDPLSTVTLTSAGSTRYSSGTPVTLPRIFGHRDVSTTACPGDRGMAALPGLRSRAAALQGGTTPAPAPAPEPAEQQPPPPPAEPFGSFDTAGGAAGAVQVTGWAIDPDAPAHTRVQVQVDGALATTLVADHRRPDVQAAYPQYSADHGFGGTVPAAPGRRRVCLTALDAPGTEHLSLGCKEVEVTSADPFGRLDSARPTSDVMGVRVLGWALDGDATTASGVTVLVDGSPVRTVPADLSRPDVASAHSGVRSESGYDLVVPALGGTRQVCVRAANQGAGADVELGCLSVDVPLRPAPVAPPGARTGTLACPAGKVPTGAFGDIGTSVHRAAVECAVWWRLTTGLTPDRYGPGLGVTRAQLATFLSRTLTSAGRTLPAAPPDAFDDDRGSPHELAINQMAAVGVVGGRSPRRYDPAGPVTREQLASYLARAYEARVGGPLPEGGDWFRDDDTSVHQASIGRVARAGFTGGTSPTAFSPGVPADRGQVAAFLVRVLDMMVEHGRARVPA